MGYEKGDMGNEKREASSGLDAWNPILKSLIHFAFSHISYPISHISLLVSLPA